MSISTHSPYSTLFYKSVMCSHYAYWTITTHNHVVKISRFLINYIVETVVQKICQFNRGRGGRDRMIVEFFSGYSGFFHQSI